MEKLFDAPPSAGFHVVSPAFHLDFPAMGGGLASSRTPLPSVNTAEKEDLAAVVQDSSIAREADDA